MATSYFRVTVEDLESGDKSVMEVAAGDYMMIPFAPCYVGHIATHANGTPRHHDQGTPARRARQTRGDPTTARDPDEAGGLMPAGMVRPRASQVEPLSAEAIATYLRRPGWRLTEHGRLDLDITTGPCARCQTPQRRYGPQGRPLCERCDPEGRRHAHHPRLSLVRPTAT